MSNPPEIIITNEKRKEVFIKVFGTHILPIKSYLPTLIEINKATKENKEAYFLDIEKLNESQKENLINYLQQKRSTSKEEILKEINEKGFPILSEGATVGIPNRFFS